MANQNPNIIQMDPSSYDTEWIQHSLWSSPSTQLQKNSLVSETCLKIHHILVLSNSYHVVSQRKNYFVQIRYPSGGESECVTSPDRCVPRLDTHYVPSDLTHSDSLMNALFNPVKLKRIPIDKTEGMDMRTSIVVPRQFLPLQSQMVRISAEKFDRNGIPQREGKSSTIDLHCLNRKVLDTAKYGNIDMRKTISETIEIRLLSSSYIEFCASYGNLIREEKMDGWNDLGENSYFSLSALLPPIPPFGFDDPIFLHHLLKIQEFAFHGRNSLLRRRFHLKERLKKKREKKQKILVHARRLHRLNTAAIAPLAQGINSLNSKSSQIMFTSGPPMPALLSTAGGRKVGVMLAVNRENEKDESSPFLGFGGDLPLNIANLFFDGAGEGEDDALYVFLDGIVYFQINVEERWDLPDCWSQLLCEKISILNSNTQQGGTIGSLSSGGNSALIALRLQLLRSKFLREDTSERSVAWLRESKPASNGNGEARVAWPPSKPRGRSRERVSVGNAAQAMATGF
ncbi:hypothetical protein M5K25_002636 [Dendrobium thyrsiflorum]|uniref:Uncharacterized protein n=1 Tax=Dendrobium thyrsiflorum TaxID=117978 RepID=A0ABD0VV80_DENTH